eukprot:TRINITY_DN31314_c1_g1_i1.p1 TRINITY_DN31314_c1_g1~~TRINITY_DN31314_c1_g1_i1.p1  ORF type:complete len:112 (+),score=14.48 TRINITY_DN31314_c1_g1_i1:162-497(+)
MMVSELDLAHITCDADAAAAAADADAAYTEVVDLYYELEVRRLSLVHTLESYTELIRELCTGDTVGQHFATTFDGMLDSRSAALDVYYARENLRNCVPPSCFDTPVYSMIH